MECGGEGVLGLAGGGDFAVVDQEGEGINPARLALGGAGQRGGSGECAGLGAHEAAGGRIGIALIEGSFAAA